MFGEILALNFDCLGSPSIKLKAGEDSKVLKTPGWGFGWYPNDDYGASIIKDAMANDTQTLLNALQDGTSFRSTIFMCKVKGAGKQYTQHDTQPFRRTFGGYDWLFLHNGQLDWTALNELHNDPSGLLEPVGKTDSELAFCFLLGKLLATSAKGLTDISGSELLAWMEKLDGLGTSDFVMSDGRSLAIYHGKNSERDLYFHRVLPSEKPPVLESDLLSLNLEDPRDSLRTVFLVTSFQFDGASSQPMQPGRLIIVRRGAIYWDTLAEANTKAQHTVAETPTAAIEDAKKTELFVSQRQEQSQTSTQTDAGEVSETKSFSNIINIKSLTHASDGIQLKYRSYDIAHLTDDDETPDLLSLNLEDPRDSLRTVFLVTSFQFDGASSQPMQPGRLIIVRRGAIYWDTLAEANTKAQHTVAETPTAAIEDAKKTELFVSQRQEQSQTSTQTDAGEVSETKSFSNIINIKSLTHASDGIPLEYRSYDIAHLTEYNYSVPVEHSTHTFRLKPVEDEIQEVLQATLELSVDGKLLQFEDVFANHSIHYDITQAYTQLLIKMKSRV